MQLWHCNKEVMCMSKDSSLRDMSNSCNTGMSMDIIIRQAPLKFLYCNYVTLLRILLYIFTEFLTTISSTGCVAEVSEENFHNSCHLRTFLLWNFLCIQCPSVCNHGDATIHNTGFSAKYNNYWHNNHQNLLFRPTIEST